MRSSSLGRLGQLLQIAIGIVNCQLLFSAVLIFLFAPAVAQQRDNAILIEYLPWTEARKVLADTTIVVIPLGAESKEHGPHLQLRNDWLIADYLTRRIAKDQFVVIYPTINYNFYPAFLEYAGSTSVRFETACSMVVDICKIISAHGPHKFYVLNTGVSTLAPLKVAKQMLAAQGIAMEYTDILNVAREAEKKVKQQPMGTHADEIETSIMLYIAPPAVDMKRAARDIPKNDSPGPLSLDPSNPRYSPTGIYGDATLATMEKGKVVVEAMVAGINKEIQSLRMASLPSVPVTSPEQFAGTYRLGPDETMIIAVEEGKLVMSAKNRKARLVPQTANSFTAGERGRLVFFRDENGNYSLVYLNWEGVDQLGKKLTIDK